MVTKVVVHARRRSLAPPSWHGRTRLRSANQAAGELLPPQDCESLNEFQVPVVLFASAAVAPSARVIGRLQPYHVVQLSRICVSPPAAVSPRHRSPFRRLCNMALRRVALAALLVTLTLAATAVARAAEVRPHPNVQPCRGLLLAIPNSSLRLHPSSIRVRAASCRALPSSRVVARVRARRPPLASPPTTRACSLAACCLARPRHRRCHTVRRGCMPEVALRHSASLFSCHGLRSPHPHEPPGDHSPGAARSRYRPPSPPACAAGAWANGGSTNVIFIYNNLLKDGSVMGWSNGCEGVQSVRERETWGAASPAEQARRRGTSGGVGWFVPWCGVRALSMGCRWRVPPQSRPPAPALPILPAKGPPVHPPPTPLAPATTPLSLGAHAAFGPLPSAGGRAGARRPASWAAAACTATTQAPRSAPQPSAQARPATAAAAAAASGCWRDWCASERRAAPQLPAPPSQNCLPACLPAPSRLPPAPSQLPACLLIVLVLSRRRHHPPERCAVVRRPPRPRAGLHEGAQCTL